MGNRFVIKALIIGDNELECDCASVTLDDLNISHVGFSDIVLDSFELIIYEGSKGTKILKSSKTKTGKVE